MTTGIGIVGTPVAARLLFVSANPGDRTPLAVEHEYKRVKRRLERLGNWRNGVEYLPAATWEDVAGELLLFGASIVHFAGHGHPDGSLEFVTDDNRPQRIDSAGLAKVFEKHADQVRLVTLNACYSDALASALSQHIDVVVGMSHAVRDEDAVLFAPTFYQQLAGGRTVLAAFEIACGVVLGIPRDDGASATRDVASSAQKRDGGGPQLRARAGVDASTMTFVGTAEVEPDRGRATVPGGEVSAIHDTLRDMHARLLAGYPADAILVAVTAAEHALTVMAGLPPEGRASLREVIGVARRGGNPGLARDAKWLVQRRNAVIDVAGEVREELDDDGRRASEIASRCAIAAGVHRVLQSGDRGAAARSLARIARTPLAFQARALRVASELPGRVRRAVLGGAVLAVCAAGSGAAAQHIRSTAQDAADERAAAVARLVRFVKDKLQTFADDRKAEADKLAAEQRRLRACRYGTSCPDDAKATGCCLCPTEMVYVPGGTFVMGSARAISNPDEQPEHSVTLSSYCIDRTEVMQGCYARCVATGKCTVMKRANDGFDGYCNRAFGDRDRHPANCVDWNEAVAYCASLGKTLPTEAEWEYAARGSDHRTYPWGNAPPTKDRLNACGGECRGQFGGAQYGGPAIYKDDDGSPTTAPVGSHPSGASPFGALDMAGNVAEWTADRFGRYSSEARTNPRGPTSGAARAVRGGGWRAATAFVVHTAFHSAFHTATAPDSRAPGLGLRCVLRDLVRHAGLQEQGDVKPR